MSRRGSEHSSGLMDAIDILPQKEEWALINKYKALEFERMKSKDRELDRMKKQRFRLQLDHQLSCQSNQQAKMKQQDILYYKRLSENAEQQRQREENLKKQKFLKRRNIENQNMHTMQSHRRSRVTDGDTGYHLHIGLQSDIEHKQLEKRFTKEMMDTLDVQLRQKEIQAKRTKQITQQKQRQHLGQQANYFKPQEKKMYGQNQQVYHYYKNIMNKKEQNQRQLEHRFIDQAIQMKLRKEDQRKRQEELKSSNQKIMVKQTLDSQVRELARKRKAQNQTNPQDVSYGFISAIFQDKYGKIDKEAYRRQLQKQAEEHRHRKVLENHMSSQQYRLNFNQLSKIVSGDYAQKNYLDRSLGAIGDNKKYELDNISKDLTDKDAEAVKHRLQVIRHGNYSSMDQRPS